MQRHVHPPSRSEQRREERTLQHLRDLDGDVAGRRRDQLLAAAVTPVPTRLAALVRLSADERRRLGIDDAAAGSWRAAGASTHRRRRCASHPEVQAGQTGPQPSCVPFREYLWRVLTELHAMAPHRPGPTHPAARARNRSCTIRRESPQCRARRRPDSQRSVLLTRPPRVRPPTLREGWSR